MRIAEWPDSEKPRDKLLQKGPASLSDAELLAIFIRTGTRGRTAVDLARELLRNFDGLRQLLESDAGKIYNFQGMGKAKYVQLVAALELGKRYLESNLKRDTVLSSPAITIDYLKFKLRAFPYEVFACIFLDNRHRIINFEELFTGTINSASIHPREVVRRGLFHNSAAVIFAHNHPSGVAEPSPADIAITHRLRDALDLVDIRVLDHVVIGDNSVVSFADRGML